MISSNVFLCTPILTHLSFLQMYEATYLIYNILAFAKVEWLLKNTSRWSNVKKK